MSHSVSARVVALLAGAGPRLTPCAVAVLLFTFPLASADEQCERRVPANLAAYLMHSADTLFPSKAEDVDVPLLLHLLKDERKALSGAQSDPLYTVAQVAREALSESVTKFKLEPIEEIRSFIPTITSSAEAADVLGILSLMRSRREAAELTVAIGNHENGKYRYAALHYLQNYRCESNAVDEFLSENLFRADPNSVAAAAFAFAARGVARKQDIDRMIELLDEEHIATNRFRRFDVREAIIRAVVVTAEPREDFRAQLSDLSESASGSVKRRARLALAVEFGERDKVVAVAEQLTDESLTPELRAAVARDLNAIPGVHLEKDFLYGLVEQARSTDSIALATAILSVIVEQDFEGKDRLVAELLSDLDPVKAGVLQSLVDAHAEQ